MLLSWATWNVPRQLNLTCARTGQAACMVMNGYRFPSLSSENKECVRKQRSFVIMVLYCGVHARAISVSLCVCQTAKQDLDPSS